MCVWIVISSYSYCYSYLSQLKEIIMNNKNNKENNKYFIFYTITVEVKVFVF